MKGLRAALLCVLAFLPFAAAYGQQLFKCVSPDGKTAYQSEPCSASGSQERLSAPPASGPGRSEPAVKLGWNRTETHFMSEACIMANFWDGRREYDAHPHPVSAPFDERALAPTVSAHCACLAQRASISWTFAEYSKNPLAFTSQLTNEAMAGGPCKPAGPHAELMRKLGRMQ